MKRVATIALSCLLAGWVGGYQHKRFKVKAQEAVAATLAASAPMQDALARMPDELQDIRAMAILLEPRLKDETDDLRTAILLRNMLYSNIPFYDDPGVRTAPFEWLRLADTFRKSLFDPGYGHKCGGRTIIYLITLRAFGITARLADMYSDVTDLPDIANSHASVEVLIDGEWIAQDATFNISLKNAAGKYIGWVEAAHDLADGKTVTHDTDGFPTFPRRTFEAYSEESGITLNIITRYMLTSPYLLDGETQPPTKTAEWDGVLHYRNGLRFDALQSASSSIYALLATPIARASISHVP
jgi:transglutaminase-like putative cysteine protease